MVKGFFSMSTVIIGLALTSGVAFAAAPFYQGRTVRIIVGYSAGGGFDAYARLLSRHMGKHIPGSPTVIVDNMPGAGGLISANHLYKVAKPDGLTIGHFSGGLFLNQIMGEPGIEFDARNFVYLGGPFKESIVCVISKARGITSIGKWMVSNTPVKFGGTGLGAVTTDNPPRILKAAIGLPIKLITGYKGVTEIRLAIEGGELDACSTGWNMVKVHWRKALETGDIIPIIQAVPKALPDLPTVPLAINLAKSEEGRRLITVGIHDNNLLSRPFVLPPKTSKEREQILREAFQETLRDKEFLEELEKAKLDIDPVTGEELEKAVLGLFKLDPAFLVKLKDILFR